VLVNTCELKKAREGRFFSTEAFLGRIPSIMFDGASHQYDRD
jgi:hypothetical protein